MKINIRHSQVEEIILAVAMKVAGNGETMESAAGIYLKEP